MNLEAYLNRIGYKGSLEPNLETLTTIHRLHLAAIPYENLDIHLGRPLGLDLEYIFQKIVYEHRGGWCYEMNGLLAWVLRELGYKVQMVSGAAGRDKSGDLAEGNHLVLLVELQGETYIADVGFGDGPLEPVPLREGSYKQGIFEYGLSQHEGRWFFHNYPGSGISGFDFTLEPRHYTDFAQKCHYLQTSPDSGFVRTTVCQTIRPEAHLTLRGAVFTAVREQGSERRTLETQAEYAQVLRDEFGLEFEGLGQLYAKVWQRHLAWAESQ